VIANLVSTIIPVYNRPAQLREAVESVLAQDYRPIEIIIVDDGSTDDTLGVAQALAEQHPDIIRVTTQSKAGPGMARECGRQLVKGEFIQYLDSDDILLPGKLTAQVQALRLHPEADVSYGITWLRKADGTLVKEPHKGTGKNIQTMFPAFLVSRWWETATSLYRSSVCDMAGPWTDLSLEEDWEYDCRIAALGGKLIWCPQPVSEHRDHMAGRLSRGTALDQNRMRQRARSHELIFGHAIRASLQGTPEMQHFARALFLLSRQCGAAGLDAESRRLFELARQASGDVRSRGLDFRIYNIAAGLLGWKNMGRLSGWLDGLRR
jgi:hypothetical protein